MSLNATIYSKRFGSKSLESKSVCVKFATEFLPVTTSSLPITSRTAIHDLILFPEHQRHIVFVLDVSISMTHSLNYLKYALTTVKDLLGPTFGTSIHVSVIAFSSHADLVFSTYRFAGKGSWDQMMSELKCSSGTNLSEALTTTSSFISLANVHGHKSIPTWLLIMTDGEPTRGIYRTKEEFVRVIGYMKSSLTLTTSVLGYCLNHNPDILSVLGDYTFITNPEKISSSLSLFTLEVLRACYLKCRITLSHPDTKLIYGSFEKDVVTPETPLYLGALLQDPSDLVVSVSFSSMNSHVQNMSIVAAQGGEAQPLSMVIKYYQNQRASIYSEISKRSPDLERARNLIDDWVIDIDALEMYSDPNPISKGLIRETYFDILSEIESVARGQQSRETAFTAVQSLTPHNRCTLPSQSRGIDQADHSELSQQVEMSSVPLYPPSRDTRVPPPDSRSCTRVGFAPATQEPSPCIL
jgi:hypothetical protein